MDNYNTYLKYISYIYNYSNKKIYIDNLKGFFISLDKCNILRINSIEEIDTFLRRYEKEGLIKIRKDFFRKSFYIDKVMINIPTYSYDKNEIDILNSFINRIF